MATTRRRFIQRSAIGTGAALFGERSAIADPAGVRRPAPTATIAPTSASLKDLDGSPLLAFEPFLAAAIDAATQGGATFAEARAMELRRESLRVRDLHVSGVRRTQSTGVGVRVIAGGAWGFAAGQVHSVADAQALASRAVKTATLNATLLRAPVEWAAEASARARWIAPHERDPFEVPLEEKTTKLMGWTRAALSISGVSYAAASVATVREEKLLLNSEGTRLHQRYFRIAPSLSATAVDRRSGAFASRSYEVPPMLAGWEFVDHAGIDADAATVGVDVLRKLHAPSVTPGPRTVILAPSNLWLTIHESIGHPTELDRSRGFEANYAGTSFIKPDDAGRLVLGSDLVDVRADRTQPGGLATTGWDDDGVPAQRWEMVDGGRFVGWQTTRDQVGWTGDARSRGCSYSSGFDKVPFQRMPNISLQPHASGYATEDLINATDDGILITGRGSWSIDQQRYNFQFSGQMFWEIKNGRVVRPLRDVGYQANTVEFWRSCDMVGGAGTYRLFGTFSDGKGEPGQSNAVSHGCPPARFRVNIVNTKGER